MTERRIPRTAAGLFLLIVGGRIWGKPQDILQPYGIMKTYDLDEQLGEMRDWNEDIDELSQKSDILRLRRLKFIREVPELAERE